MIIVMEIDSTILALYRRETEVMTENKSDMWKIAYREEGPVKEGSFFHWFLDSLRFMVVLWHCKIASSVVEVNWSDSYWLYKNAQYAMATTNFNVSIFFFVFQLVFWCFNTHPKTSMTWFLVLFFFVFFFVCFCFLVWLYSLQWHILCIRKRYQKPLLTLTVLLNKQAPKASPCLFVWPYVKWFFFSPPWEAVNTLINTNTQSF